MKPHQKGGVRKSTPPYAGWYAPKAVIPGPPGRARNRTLRVVRNSRLMQRQLGPETSGTYPLRKSVAKVTDCEWLLFGAPRLKPPFRSRPIPAVQFGYLKGLGAVIPGQARLCI